MLRTRHWSDWKGIEVGMGLLPPDFTFACLAKHEQNTIAPCSIDARGIAHLAG